MNHGSFFSGIGGFDLAAEWMGWENKFHCEINEFCQKILNYYWPNAKSYADIKTTDFSIWRGKIDIISGGFPCQPYSQAGKRKGKADDRHLWPEMLRAIREIQPRWVVGENVSGLLNWERGMVLDEIKADLETAGFEVFPSLVLPACGKNAPHRRDRLWIIANNSTNANGSSKSEIRRNDEEVCRLQDEKCRTENSSALFGGNGVKDNGVVADTTAIRMEGGGAAGKQEPRTHEQQELFMRGNSRTNWNEWPTQSPICSRDDGLSNELDGITISKHRKESLMAYGNSIVPQVVLEIFKSIEQSELNNYGKET